MTKGFYNLTSAMLTHGRMLDISSNNIANVATAGFKTDRFTGATFQEVMWQITGNRIKNYQDIGEQSFITAPSQMYTDFTQGSLDHTGLLLDFAINGPGWFAIERRNIEINEETGAEEENIERLYTRGGSFMLDNEGYLYLAGQGRVLSATEQPIQLVTDRLNPDNYGGLYTDNGAFRGRIGVFVFGDGSAESNEENLEKNAQGLFTANEGAEPQVRTTQVLNGWVERSNMDWVKEMTQMLSIQRAYQSAAEVIKIYDNILTRVTQEAGRLT